MGRLASTARALTILVGILAASLGTSALPPPELPFPASHKPGAGEPDGVATCVLGPCVSDRPIAGTSDAGAVVVDTVVARETFTAYDPLWFVPETGLALTPGLYRFGTWYGVWSDLDQDGVIDDTNGGAVPDEYDPLPASDLAMWVWPWNPRATVVPDRPALLDPDPYSVAPDFEVFQDYHAEGWGYGPGAGWPLAVTDAGFMVTLFVVTAAAPLESPGSAWEYEPDSSIAVDVDRYDAVSEDAGTLYASNVMPHGAALASVASSLETALRCAADSRAC